ncbi:MAG: phenylalanine--tRNA ligase subunit beta [Colwelliaceae bacterium]|nr:phenylalanine--tRNA ligase subunit beta [Colwelliaceae bacterium]|tara:strand:- start:2188 stop:3822 length:1635 start_codon:yes stop_codon:yes gene_type:complete
MANVKFPRKEFESHIKITPQVEERISLFGTPLESLTEDEIELEIFPNRPDLLSMQGYLRAFKDFLGRPGSKQHKINPPERNYTVKIGSSVKNVRPFTACAIVKNLKFNDEKIKEIIDLQEKLHSTTGRNRKKAAIGIYPLEKIKLPITYTAQDPRKIKFTPLEFDRELNALQILQKHPTGREYAHLLSDCPKFPVFLDANDKVLSLPPIINSNETGKITPETKSVFIECSGFDLETLKKTLNIIVTTLADQGGKVYAMNLQYDKKIITPDLSPQTTKLKLENANKLLGLELKESDLAPLLKKMGHTYSKGVVSSPAWRTDILHEVDLIEDIAIAYGYDKFVPEIPTVATIAEESKESKIKRKVSEILAGLGLIETSSYHLIKKEESILAKIKDPIVLADSKTDYKILRPNLVIPSLRILSENKDNEYPQRIFEIGTVFSQDARTKTESGILEQENLCICSSPSNFTQIKQILDYLSRALNLPFSLKEANSPGLIEGRSALILLHNKVIGYLGEAHPETLRAWNIKMPLSILEISLEPIFNSISI